MNTPSSSSSDRRGWWEMIKSCSGTETDRRNQYWFLFWGVVWAIAFVASSWALRGDLAFRGTAAWAIAIAPIVVGIIPVLAYLRFLREADELLRRIQLEGLAFGSAVGAIFAICYPLLERAGAPHLELSSLVIVMAFAWAVGRLLGIVRYR